MFTVTISEYYGPFCGHGGYGGATGRATHRSPKRAMELARERQALAERTANLGGGVPILSITKMWKGHRLIVDRC